MRIGDLVTMAMGPIGVVERPKQQPLDALLALVNSGGDQGSSSPQLKMPAIDAPQPAKPTDTTDGSGDVVDLSPDAQAASTSGRDQSNPDAPATGSSALGGLVEKFIRKRAIFAYSQPGKTPTSPSFNFVMDVEIAYRVIQPIEPGTTLDIQA